MIRFGPSGIPLSCKGRTLRDGIEDVHNLGLSAMEVQLGRVNVLERPAAEEEVGQTPRVLPGELVVEIRRREDKKEVRIPGLDEKIEPGDTLVSLTSGLARDYLELEQLGTISREMDIELSLHTPYYMDLGGTGSLEEFLGIAKVGGGVAPVLNFAHVHAREGGLLKRPEDFAAVIEKAEKAAGPHVHTHFTGVEHEGGSELRYTPIKKGDLRFEPLAECLLDNDYDLTIVSSSPLLEHDAMYMKVILERVLAKKLVKVPRVPGKKVEAR